MATTIPLEDARTRLAEETGLLIEGVAEVGSDTTSIIDTAHLEHLTRDDVLIGWLAYIRSAGAAVPEGQARRIIDFAQATSDITVEYAYTAAVENGDTYEVYKAPLSLDEWDLCINQAITDAWPLVWTREIYSASVVTQIYNMPAAAEEVIGVVLGRWRWLLPHSEWISHGDPRDLDVELLVPVIVGRDIRIVYKARYPELGVGDATALDVGYLMAGAKAHLYATLADYAGTQTDASRYLSLMKHWQEVAHRKLLELNRALLLQDGPGKDGD